MPHSGERVCWVAAVVWPNPAASRQRNRGGRMESMAVDDSLQLTWLTRLIATHSPDEVAEAIVGLAREQPGCEAAWVLWHLHDGARRRSVPRTSIDTADGPWLERAAG